MNEKDLLKNWSDDQFAKVEDAISSYYQTPINEISEILGLAFTSSSAFAALWICSKYNYFKRNPNYHIRGFALSKDEKVVIYCEDYNGNEAYFLM